MVSGDVAGEGYSQRDSKSSRASGWAAATGEKTWVVKGSSGGGVSGAGAGAGDDAISKRRRPRLRPRAQRKEGQAPRKEGDWEPRKDSLKESNGSASGEEEYEEEEEEEEECRAKDPASTVYDRCLLLQFYPMCKSRTLSGASTSAGSSPRSQGSLHCAPVEPPADAKDPQKHADSTERPIVKQKGIAEEVDANEPLKVEMSMVVEPPVGLAPPAVPVSGVTRKLLEVDSPVTVVLWNIPVEYDRTSLCECLEEHDFGYAIDFLYLPIDAQADRNLGCATINLRTQASYKEFFEVFHGVPASSCLAAFPSTATCEVSLAEVQGREANMQMLCTTANMKLWVNHDPWQPLFLADDGTRLVFPSPPSRKRSDSEVSDTKDSEKCTQMKATSNEFVPNQLNLLLSALVTSPSLRADAPEFVPSSFSLDSEVPS